MFRWLTAGESHGRALVAVCEGVPAGVRLTTEDIAAALARRRAGYGRGARMTFEQDEVELTGGRPARHHAGRPDRDQDRQHRMAQVGDGHVRRPGGRGGAGRAGQERPADQAPARARRPGRHAEVRPHRRPSRCWSGPARGRRPPGSRSARWPGACSARSWASRSSATWWPSGRSGPRTASCRARGDQAAIDADPVRCADPDYEPGHGGRDRRGPQGRRHAGRRRGGAGLTACRPGWAASRTGTGGSTPGWPGR